MASGRPTPQHVIEQIREYAAQGYSANWIKDKLKIGKDQAQKYMRGYRPDEGGRESITLPPSVAIQPQAVEPVKGEPWWYRYGVQHDDGRKLILQKMPEKVLVFSCSQAPFHHKETIAFLSMVIADTRPDMIVMAGDLVDFKFMKKKFMGPDDLSPTQELERAIDFCEQLFRIIPEAICLTSNHAEGRVSFAQKEGNIPSVFLRKWQEVVGMPKGWITREALLTGNYLIEHGDGVSKGARASIREEMIRRFGRPLSVVRGHRHNLFGEVAVPEWETPTWQRRLCYVGCTMDAEQVDYSKTGLWNGCILINRGIPMPIPMERNQSNQWSGRLASW